MEKAIETIWKEGFMEEKLIIPSKVNDLYNKKSKMLFEDLRKTSKWDQLSLVLIAVVFLAFFSIRGEILLGIYSLAGLVSLFFVNKKHLDQLLAINQHDNCYTFLTSLRSGINKTIKYYTRLLTIASPLALGLGFLLYYWNQKIPQETLIVALTVTVIMPLISITAYRLSNKLLYGSMLKNLDTMIEEMDELKV
jgi:hypothetical protein